MRNSLSRGRLAAIAAGGVLAIGAAGGIYAGTASAASWSYEKYYWTYESPDACNAMGNTLVNDGDHPIGVGWRCASANDGTKSDLYIRYA